MPIERPMVSVEALVTAIEPGMMIALPKDESGVAMEAERALIRSGVTGLHLLCVPACGYQADILIGAGCVSTVECAGIIVSEFGVGPQFKAAVRSAAPLRCVTDLPCDPWWVAGRREGLTVRRDTRSARIRSCKNPEGLARDR